MLTIDFETYYDKTYSLSKLSTEAYVKDPRFEVILVAVKVDDQPVQWKSGGHRHLKEWLDQFDIPNQAVVCHNMMFDGLILKEIFGLTPKLYVDTLFMANAVLRPFIKSVSLKACLEFCDFDGLRKGTEVQNMLGRSRQSLSSTEMRDYAQYCCTDVQGTYLLFRKLRQEIPNSEMLIIDLTLRMYLDPVMELDSRLLAEIANEERARKEQLLASIPETREDLMSNDKFAVALRRVGVVPPVKISLTTGKETWAFSKDDAEFKQMQEECADNPEAMALIEARLGVKSTINETRSDRLLQIALQFKKLRVPLMYYAAHTGRYGGTQKINMQNPPRVDKSRIRFAMKAPKGSVIIAADLSQIEARVVAWLAGETNLVSDFANNEDVYAKFASYAYKIETVKKRSKEDDARRFVGKTCILGLGYGMGAPKLQLTLRKDGIKIDLQEAARLVDAYRSLYSKIPQLWARFGTSLNNIASGVGKVVIGPVQTDKGRIILPNGMHLHYSNLRNQDRNWVYEYGRETRKLFGGKVVENVVQALARIVVMDNMITIYNSLGLRPVLQVHDELDYVVSEAHAENYIREIARIMSSPPVWAPDLPVAVEIAFGPTFGDCK